MMIFLTRKNLFIHYWLEYILPVWQQQIAMALRM